MKSFANVNARDLKDAALRLREPNAIAIGGGSDLLGMVKDHLVQPDVLVKGADWPADQIVGRDTVEARGGKVVLERVEQGHSTTAIIDKIRAFDAEA